MAVSEVPLSRRLVDAVLARHAPQQARWHYEHGLLLKAVEAVYRRDGDPVLFRFIQTFFDAFVGPDGTIATYRPDEFNIDQINPGKNLLFLWEATGERRYRLAIETLRDQLRRHPRTLSLGFWHKKIYPHQIWLDGLYMEAPFYAQATALFGPASDFADVVRQFVLIEDRARDPGTGLLYHAWDESRTMPWSHPQTGCSPHFWSRAMGWYGMALVDSLDWLPPDRGAETLTAILGRYAQAVKSVQDPSGLWFQVLDEGQRPGNYLESSGSAMFAYTLAKAVRRGWLDPSYRSVAASALEGLVSLKVKTEAGLPSLIDTCAVAGLGGSPYRDGSFDYYVNEKRATNDFKGLGPLILAALEMEVSPHD